MKSILVADDQRMLRVLIRSALKNPAWKVLEASDGDEALEMAREHRPDLFVLDWMMPGKDGIEVAAQLRRERATKNTPIILLTAHAEAGGMQAALATGVTAYVVKPFNPEDLRDRVRELLG